MIRIAFILLVVALPLFAIGCDIFDEDEAGAGSGTSVQLRLVDSGLAPQTLGEDDPAPQIVLWGVDSATITIDGLQLDLQPTGPCRVLAASRPLPTQGGACYGAIAIDRSGFRRSTLDLGPLTMEVGRVTPLTLPPFTDYDGDGIANGDDVCPLLSDPAQADANGDGIGDECTVIDSSMGALRDSDADGVPDRIDNCVWGANPAQDDTTGDGIGDACSQFRQVARVQLAGQPSFELGLGPEELPLQAGRVNYVLVDFVSSGALSCDWDAGVCVLDPTQVRLCATASQAATGC